MRRVNLKKILFVLHFTTLQFTTRQGYNVKNVSTKNNGIYLSLLDVQYLTQKGITSTYFDQNFFRKQTSRETLNLAGAYYRKG